MTLVSGFPTILQPVQPLCLVLSADLTNSLCLALSADFLRHASTLVGVADLLAQGIDGVLLGHLERYILCIGLDSRNSLRVATLGNSDTIVFVLLHSLCRQRATHTAVCTLGAEITTRTFIPVFPNLHTGAELAKYKPYRTAHSCQFGCFLLYDLWYYMQRSCSTVMLFAAQTVSQSKRRWASKLSQVLATLPRPNRLRRILRQCNMQ